MSSRAAKRREIADKLSADVARLRKEIGDRRKYLGQAKERALSKEIARNFLKLKDHDINLPPPISVYPSWFATWSRHAPALARAVGQLERCLKRLPTAIDKAEVAAMLAREERDRLVRIKAANEGYMRRLDALKADAPTIDARWRKERIQEEKRLKVLQKKLHKRTTKDYTARPDWMQKPVKLPDPIKQPDLSTFLPDSVVDAPPREGLIAGTFTMMDPRRMARLVDRPRTPKVWTATYVGVRLIEAHRVLAKMPGTIWPKGFGAAWPAYKVEAGEAAIQAGAGTLAMGRNTIRSAPSAEAVARMNEAVSWPMQFLANRPGAAADVNWWAADAAWDQMDFDSRSAPWVELQIIADALNAAKEVVR